MPESGAIERTRDAMNAWLRADLPADFNQLRADLNHILDCIPETHATPCPSTGPTHVRPDGTHLIAICRYPIGHTGTHEDHYHAAWA